MKLKTDGLLTRFYARSYNLESGGLPSNFCTFFWRLVFAVVVLPLTWWTYFWRLPGEGARFGIGFITAVIIAGMVDGFYQNWLTTLLVIFGFALLLGIIALICYWADEGPPEFIGEAADVVSTKWTSTKENYCPKIDWQ